MPSVCLECWIEACVLFLFRSSHCRLMWWQSFSSPRSFMDRSGHITSTRCTTATTTSTTPSLSSAVSVFLSIQSWIHWSTTQILHLLCPRLYKNINALHLERSQWHRKKWSIIKEHINTEELTGVHLQTYKYSSGETFVHLLTTDKHGPATHSWSQF